jgi:Ni,Fe-hydrogenase III component G
MDASVFATQRKTLAADDTQPSDVTLPSLLQIAQSDTPSVTLDVVANRRKRKRRSVPEPCFIALNAEQELRDGRLRLIVGQERHLRLHLLPEVFCCIPILSLQQPLLLDEEHTSTSAYAGPA